MSQENFNFFSAVIAVISLIVTIVGLYAVYMQLKKIKETTWSNTHSKLADQSFELLKLLSDHPNTYDYFYHKKPLENNAPEKIIVLYLAEALTNFMEHLILQKPNLPQKQWEVWRRFIYTTFKSSVVLRNFIQENREWYSEDLLKIADDCKILY